MKVPSMQWKSIVFTGLAVCVVGVFCRGVLSNSVPPTDPPPQPPPAQANCSNPVVINPNITRAPGRCIWYGECIGNLATDKKFNCFYNGPAVSFDNTSAEYSLIHELCPWYIKNGTGKVCCDVDQMRTFKDQTSVARSLLIRCKACYQNFMMHFCATTCDPDQSLFMDPSQPNPDPFNGPPTISTVKTCNTSDRKSVKYIEAVNVITDPTYAEDMYDSCKGVQYTEQPGPVINLMCGTDDCNYRKFLYFLGDPALDYNQAPFFMNYIFTSTVSDGKTPLKKDMLECDNAGSLTCSCTDCQSPKICPPLPEPPKDSSAWIKYYDIGMAAFGFTFTLLVSGMAMLFAIYDMCHKNSQQHFFNDEDKKNTEEDDNSTSSSINSDPPAIDDDIDDDSFILCKAGAYLEFVIKAGFYRWGHFASKRWYVVLPAVFLCFGAFIGGLYFFDVTTDPVELWSASNSRARLEKGYYDRNFGPFYRTEQVIITSSNFTPYNIVTSSIPPETFHMGPVMHLPVLLESFYLQRNLSNIVAPFYDANGEFIKNVTLEDICFQPLSPDNTNCTIESVFNYFQNSLDKFLYKELNDFNLPIYNASWHIHYCTRNPTALKSKYIEAGGPNIPCMAAYGGPVDPNVALGGFTADRGFWYYENASALIITFIVNNHVNESQNAWAEAWEAEFIKYLKSYKGRYINISFSSERSITDEINRESRTDILTIAISYGAMFIYIAIFLGHFRSLYSIMVDIKVTLGLFGVFIVIVAVAASIGLLRYMNIMASLIILEVVPFLVLAVGVDNLFILVHSYERVHRKYPNMPVDYQIGRALGEVAPSLLLTATSESAAFLLGAISSMPAVRSFSLYAGVAVFFNFVLQISAFVSVMSLDAKRQRRYMSDIICIPLDKSRLSDSKEKPSLLFLFMKKIWTLVVLHPLMRPVWLFVFGILFFSGMCLIPRVEIGLDQRLALPTDSFLQNWFNDMNKYLHIGPPVYVVIKKGFNLTNPQSQDLVCSGSGCNPYSLGEQLSMASRVSNVTRIAEPGSIWLDTYYQWLGDSSQCCGFNPINNSFCLTPDNSPGSNCTHCLSSHEQRPTVEEFRRFLPDFLAANPTQTCATGGHAAYKHAVVLNEQNDVITSYVMTYHTILRNSSDYISALKNAREICDNLTKTLGSEVFPYSVFYVYYEQYLHIIKDMGLNIGVSMGAVFIVTVGMLGLNVWGALVIIAVVFMILVNMGGAMALFGITANAVSLVNLVMTVGISIEFCSHITRWFISCSKKTKRDRAKSALANMGSSVVSGITITKFIGVFILAFAKSQLFEVYYFRMYMSMVVIGAAHGLIFLPVLLSYVGPPYCPVKTPSPYPNFASNVVHEPVFSSDHSDHQGYPAPTHSKNPDINNQQNGQQSLYPQLDVSAYNYSSQVGNYPAPTHHSTERTPLLNNH